MAYRSSENIENETDYIVAGRKLPLYLAWGTLLATWYGAASVIGAPDVARNEGLSGGVILDPLACGVCLILTGIFLAGRVWKLELLTTGDLFARAYGKKTEVTSSVIQSISYFPWIAGQYVALAGVFQSTMGIPTEWGVILAAVVIMILTLSGGMWSVTTTDTAQIVVVIICMMMIFVQIMMFLGNGSFLGGINHVTTKTDPKLLTLLPEGTAVAIMGWLALWSTGLFGNVPGQDLMQRVFASKSPATARNACILAGVVYILLGLLPVTLGLASKFLIHGDEKEKVILELSTMALTPMFQILFLIAVVGAVISTGTSAILSPACLMGKNILQQVSIWKYGTLTTTKICVVFVTIFSVPFALLSDSIISLLDQALAISMVSVCVPFLIAIYSTKPQGDLRGMVSVLVGTFTWLLHLIIGSNITPLKALSDNGQFLYLLDMLAIVHPEFTGITACCLILILWPTPKTNVSQPQQA
jgi:Na+/proline symporter